MTAIPAGHGHGVAFTWIRRATDFLRADTGGTFLQWLRDQGADDDPVEVAGRRTTLSEVITRRATGCP